jgi:hypothetical protein
MRGSLDPTQQRRQFLNFFDCPGSTSQGPSRVPSGSSSRDDLQTLQHRSLALPARCRPRCWAFASTAQSMTITPPKPSIPAFKGHSCFWHVTQALQQRSPLPHLALSNRNLGDQRRHGPSRDSILEAGIKGRIPLYQPSSEGHSLKGCPGRGPTLGTWSPFIGLGTGDCQFQWKISLTMVLLEAAEAVLGVESQGFAACSGATAALRGPSHRRDW